MAEEEAFWATISTLSERLREKTPQGMTAVIAIETFDGRTFTPAAAQRYPPWVIFEMSEPENESALEVVFVREEDVRRVHMRYERGEKPGLGFALREIDLK